MEFKLKSKYQPAGDQPDAIKKILNELETQDDLVLLGATGNGKTFTMANIIEKYKKPTLILAPNKTLANQLYLELKDLFPNNRVEYYISNFDFYQPEAYKPSTDSFIEKTSKQNWQLEMMRVSATTSLLTRNDVIVVASVAAIFGHRNPKEYRDMFYEVAKDTPVQRKKLLYNLIQLGYERKDELSPGTFVGKGDVIEICPSWTDQFHIRIELFGDQIEAIKEINSIEKNVIRQHNTFTIFPANFHVTREEQLKKIIPKIEKDLSKRLGYFRSKNKLIEAQRLEQRIKLDIEQLQEFGIVSGIENYSIYFDEFRKEGETPSTLIDYFPKDFLMIIDESHLSLPQIRGMYEGDKSRKQTLVNYGFRLPTALDNRPLFFDEFINKLNKTIYLSATPGDYELLKVNNKYIEQIIRPTGLLDPQIEVRKENNQIYDLMNEIFICKKNNERVFINTVTKKLAEDISAYMSEKGLSIAYIHSDLKTLEREEVLIKLRKGIYDAVVGVNLLREGLDIPEVSLVAILDANKNGFMRNTRSLIQLIGRAARNKNGRVIMYADYYSTSMESAIKETKRRRDIQIEFNKKHNIKPKTISKPIPQPVLEEFEQKHNIKLSKLKKEDKIKKLEEEMKIAASKHDFETAIKLRDLLTEYKNN